MKKLIQKAKKELLRKEAGVDGILVTVGLCVIALVLCVVMKESMTTFITTMVAQMSSKAATILSAA